MLILIRTLPLLIRARYLPQNQSAWPEALTTHRQSYMRLAAEFGIESHLDDGNYRRLDADLFRCIELDTERTFSRGNLFSSEAVKKMMKTILFIFAKVNPGIGYVSVIKFNPKQRALKCYWYVLYWVFAGNERGARSVITRIWR